MTKANFKRIYRDLEIFMDRFNPGGPMNLLNRFDRQLAIEKCKRLLEKGIQIISYEEEARIKKDISFLQTYA